MPLLIVNVKHASELVILFLTIFGVYFSIRERKLPFFHDQLKVYSYLVLAFFFSIVISVILSNNPIQGIHRIGSNIHFLVAPFVAYGIYKSNVDLKHIVFAIKLSVIVATVYAIYVHSASRLEVNADAPTIYGFIMVLFGFAVIIDVWTQSKKEKLFSIFIFILAMYSVVLSGTRIAWVIFVVLFFSAMLIWSIRGHLTKKSLLLILIALAVVTAFSMNNKSFSHRIDNAFQEIKNYSVDSDSKGSVDLRLSMWSGGFEAFKQQPIIGYGYHNTGLEASRHVSGPYAKAFIKGQKMLHNDYVNSLVGFGILGLLALMALLFLPLTLFFKQLKADKECARSAIGVLFIVALSVFAITDSIYSHSVMRSFFVFFLGVLLLTDRKKVSPP
ncbi:O-antigen ligase family protein [Candidatus Thioglobus sp.]|nr:O-antigen ligase family protein [Candidatus Thioglobus sp.]